MHNENLIESKSFEFALSIVQLARSIQSEQKEYILSKQLIRSGTAIGALVHEAAYAESKKDFVHKMSIALKEANETRYWLKLIYRSNFLDHSLYERLKYNITEIVKILTSIVKSAKNNLASYRS